MSELYSINQVADLLGLHVRTVRKHVRDGRLAATRIGRQYRISRQDLEAYTGQPLADPRETSRRRRVTVSTTVAIEAIDPAASQRITNGLVATVGARPRGDSRTPLGLETVYDPAGGRLKIIVTGELGAVAYLLKLIDVYLDPDS